MTKLLAPIFVVLALSGCAQQAKYNWGSYPVSLYEYYKDATREPAYVAALEKIIKEESPKNKVPPGIFAEYGYVELQRGNTASAITYFEKEKVAWPESSGFMDSAIKLAQGDKKASVAPQPSSTPVS